MGMREIKIYPDPVLRETCGKVTEFGSALKSLTTDMALTMYASSGIGLAALQVGLLERVAVVDDYAKQHERLIIINTESVWTQGAIPSEEGCLSIPEFREIIQRKEHIVLQAQDEKGKDFELQASGILAICIQHEVDHLNGVLFIDHLSRLKRDFFKKWHRKQALEQNE